VTPRRVVASGLHSPFILHGDDHCRPETPRLRIGDRSRSCRCWMSPAWCRKEAAHVVLHKGPPGQYLPRAVKEVEAESVAYVVASVHGMATDGYSFPYVAG